MAYSRAAVELGVDDLPDAWLLAANRLRIEEPDSVRYLGTIGTPEMVRDIIDKPEVAVPSWVSDLILIDELTENSIVIAASALMERGEVEKALDRVAPEEDDGLEGELA